jgi:DNA-binding CsgD family transcriptional regulator
MEATGSDISYYKSLLATRLKEAFLYEKVVSPIDRQALIEKYRSLLDNINGFIVICNYTTGLYEYISDGIRSHLGHDVSGFSEEQLTNFVLSIIDERHRDFLLNSFMPVVFNYFNENSSRIKARDFRYACCMKVRNAYGKYLWYLIDTVVIEADANDFPLRTLITCTNIHQFKNDDRIYYNLQCKNSDNTFEVVLEGSDGQDKLAYNLTPRELQVINMISVGHTNQQIADKLFVSLNTVKTHRKNILKKTKCKGTADLTNFAFSRGLI